MFPSLWKILTIVENTCNEFNGTLQSKSKSLCGFGLVKLGRLKELILTQ